VLRHYRLISILWVIYGYSMAFDTTGMEKGVSTSTPSSAASQGVPRGVTPSSLTGPGAVP
jgi:Amt family ammonium transporter